MSATSNITVKQATGTFDYGIVILNYNSGSATVSLVDRLLNDIIGSVELIVVDNASTDNSMDLLSRFKNHSQVKVIQSGKNGGYAFGNNIGIRQAKKDNCLYVMIMNSDISISSSVLKGLLTYMDSSPDVAIASPVLVTPHSEDTYGRKNCLGKIHSWHNVKPTNLNEPVRVDSIVGACFLVRMSAIDQVGLLPEEYFLNFEETEWCIRFNRAGYKVVCLPYLRVDHINHGSTGQINGLQYYFMKRNLVLFNRRLASKRQLGWLLIKLIPFGLLQALKRRTFLPLVAYYDGLTGKNRFVDGGSRYFSSR